MNIWPWSRIQILKDVNKSLERRNAELVRELTETRSDRNRAEANASEFFETRQNLDLELDKATAQLAEWQNRATYAELKLDRITHRGRKLGPRKKKAA